MPQSECQRCARLGRQCGECSFRVQLDAAREWERKLGAWVRGRGWFIVPTYDFSGKDSNKAPKLLAPPSDVNLVLPDLLCFRQGESQWLECKWKASATFYRKKQVLETGIASRLWRHYQRVEQITISRVIVAFLHEKEAEVRGASLKELRPLISHVDQSDKMQRGGMTFFRYEEIPRWGDLAALPAVAA